MNDINKLINKMKIINIISYEKFRFDQIMSTKINDRSYKLRLLNQCLINVIWANLNLEIEDV